MPWPTPPPPGVFCATPYHMAMRDVSAQVRASVLSADWPAPPGVHALTTLRGPVGDSVPPFESFNLGLRCGDDAAAVAGNRVMLEKGLELPSPLHWLQQVHGVGVAHFDGPRSGQALPAQAGAPDEPEADAAITQTPDTVLAILTADCLPVVFAARDGSEIAIAHASRRAGGDRHRDAHETRRHCCLAGARCRCRCL